MHDAKYDLQKRILCVRFMYLIPSLEQQSDKTTNHHIITSKQVLHLVQWNVLWMRRCAESLTDEVV